MFQVGRDLLRSCQTSQLKQDPAEQIAQGVSSQVLSTSTSGDPTTSLGNVYQCSVTLAITKLSVLWLSLSVHMEFHVL